MYAKLVEKYFALATLDFFFSPSAPSSRFSIVTPYDSSSQFVTMFSSPPTRTSSPAPPPSLDPSSSEPPSSILPADDPIFLPLFPLSSPSRERFFDLLDAESASFFSPLASSLPRHPPSTRTVSSPTPSLDSSDESTSAQSTVSTSVPSEGIDDCYLPEFDFDAPFALPYEFRNPDEILELSYQKPAERAQGRELRTVKRSTVPVPPSDFYSPTWIRSGGGRGERGDEGLCNICENGNTEVGEWKSWYNLFSEDYADHLAFSHGVSPNYHLPYLPPMIIRPSSLEENRVDGKCPICWNWVDDCGGWSGDSIVDMKVWWQHARACQPDPAIIQRLYGAILLPPKAVSTQSPSQNAIKTPRRQTPTLIAPSPSPLAYPASSSAHCPEAYQSDSSREGSKHSPFQPEDSDNSHASTSFALPTHDFLSYPTTSHQRGNKKRQIHPPSYHEEEVDSDYDLTPKRVRKL